MNGKMLTQEFLHFIDTRDLSDDYATQRKVYECLDMAASIFTRETRQLRNTVSLTTQAGTQYYDLPPDFIDIYLQTSSGRFFIRYDDGDRRSFPALTNYDSLFLADRAEWEAIPSSVAITYGSPSGPTSARRRIGFAAEDGPLSEGVSLLRDATTPFADSYGAILAPRVYPRDQITNINDQSSGYVLEILGIDQISTALFGGTVNAWTSNDEYRITAAARKTLMLPAPSLTTGHIITIPYICMPPPVFSDQGDWYLEDRTCRAIASGAASLFKLPKAEFKETQALGSLFVEEIKRYKIESGAQKLKEGPSRRRERL